MDMTEMGPRFFKVVKSHMMRNLATPAGLKDLGESQMWVLHALTRGKYLTSELARHYNVTNPTMTRVVDALVEKGYVQRQPDAEDRRCIFLQLTEQGSGLGRNITTHLRDATIEFLSPLSDEQIMDIRKAYSHIASLLPDKGNETDHQASAKAAGTAAGSR